MAIPIVALFDPIKLSMLPQSAACAAVLGSVKCIETSVEVAILIVRIFDSIKLIVP